ncbi:MAG: CDP-archaeol synthase [Planctomycetota bacterium]|nr:CDP-archaeol synthase [Planctomycetota bacterium]
MLLQRVLAATLLICLLTGCMCADYYYFENSYLLHVIVLAGTFFALREFWALCRARGLQTFSTWGTFSGLMLVAAHFWALQIWSTPGDNVTERLIYLHRADKIITGGMAVAVMGVFLLTARRHQYEASIGGLGVTCLGLIYLWFLPSFLMKLRHMGVDGLLGGRDWSHFGAKMVVATIVVSKGCDVFAYLVGRKIGKHKAFPDLSPGKTKEGVAAGILGSVLLALLLRLPFVNVLDPAVFNFMETVLFGVFIGFSGILGDLSESLLKRSAGVKDASHYVPGYGGVLDVIDSLVVAGPVAYFLIPVMIHWL